LGLAGRVVILVANAGSSSLKLSVVADDESSTRVASFADAPAGVTAVAHRIVHGGRRFTEPIVVDDAVRDQIEALDELAPLHNAVQVKVIDEARELLPDLPHVAVFDTAFHATIPAVAATYAVPRRWADDWGVRRYGFHGLSVQWAADQVRVPRLIVCHLGAGCSVTAVLNGRSVDTTMGFSPLEGVPMATRSGSIDPAIPLFLIRTGRLSADEVAHALERESGLLGVSGLSSRVEELEQSADPDAGLALDVFAYRIACAVSSLVVPLGGLDALVFTGGVGEHSEAVRADVCDRVAFLGIGSGSVSVHVITAREDVVAAREARHVLAG
jgi:acetate kinase